MCDAHGLENVLLEVVVEFEARNAFDQDAGPIDVDAILPGLGQREGVSLTRGTSTTGEVRGVLTPKLTSPGWFTSGCDM